jgi:hypothetical protein
MLSNDTPELSLSSLCMRISRKRKKHGKSVHVIRKSRGLNALNSFGEYYNNDTDSIVFLVSDEQVFEETEEEYVLEIEEVPT